MTRRSHGRGFAAIGLLTLLACDTVPPPARDARARPAAGDGAGPVAVAVVLGRVEGVPPVSPSVVHADPVGEHASAPRAATVTTALEANGTWTLTVPAPGRYRIAVTEPGALFSPSETTLAIGRGDTVRLRWRRARPTEGLPPDVADALDSVPDTWPTDTTATSRGTKPAAPAPTTRPAPGRRDGSARPDSGRAARTHPPT